MGFLKRQWFLVALACVLLFGFAFPERLERFAEFKLMRSMVVAAVLFVTALSLETRQIGQSLRRPVAPLLASAINMGVLPLLAIFVSRFLDGDWATGLIVAGAVPSTIASAAVWTRRAGGNDVVALVVTVITNSLCFLVTPVWVAFGSGRTGVTIELAPMIQKLAILVLLPMLFAQILRQNRSIASWSATHRWLLSLFAQVGILLIVLVGAIHCGLEVSTMKVHAILYSGAAMLLAVVSIHLSMLWLGQATGRAIGLDRADWIAVGFSGSQKTLMVGLQVALMLGGGLMILPMVAYHVCQLVVDTIVADHLKLATSEEMKNEK